MEDLHQQAHETMVTSTKMLAMVHDEILAAHKEDRTPEYGLIFMALSLTKGAIDVLSAMSMGMCLEHNPAMYSNIREYESLLEEKVALSMAATLIEPSMN
jgi:hypothetical protein